MTSGQEASEENANLQLQAQFAWFVLKVTLGLAAPLVFFWGLGVAVAQTSLGRRPDEEAMKVVKVGGICWLLLCLTLLFSACDDGVRNRVQNWVRVHDPARASTYLGLEQDLKGIEHLHGAVIEWSATLGPNSVYSRPDSRPH